MTGHEMLLNRFLTYIFVLLYNHPASVMDSNADSA